MSKHIPKDPEDLKDLEKAGFKPVRVYEVVYYYTMHNPRIVFLTKDKKRAIAEREKFLEKDEEYFKNNPEAGFRALSKPKPYGIFGNETDYFEINGVVVKISQFFETTHDETLENSKGK